MANYLGTKLSRVVRERAYAAGVVERKARRVTALKAALNAAVRELRDAQTLLDGHDRDIASMSTINASNIRPIKHFPKSGLFKFGDLSRAIVQILKEANAPVQTPDVIIGVSGALDLPLHTTTDWAVARRRVVKQLQEYARKGAVQRLHDLKKSEVGSWLWIGL